MSGGVGALRLPSFRWLRRKRAKARPAPLTFGREKRRLLGTLALVVALPLPLNEPQPQGVIGWPGLLLYLSVVGIFLWRVGSDREALLPGWAMNLMGLAYIPWFLFRLRSAGPTNIAQPMVEVLLFGLVVKLFSMRRESEKWHVAVLIFFLFVAAMATSVHPLIIVYLLVFLVLWLTLLFRFVQLHLMSSYREAVPSGRGLALQPLLLACTLLTLVGSIPFFAFLPRLRTPYILGSGINQGRQSYSTGFRDEVNLDVVGNIRRNQAVALRLKPEDSTLQAPRMLRGTTYDTFEGNAWTKSRPVPEPLNPANRNLYRLADGDIAGKMRVWLEPLESTSLILPMETVSVELSQRLYSDVGGGVLVNQPGRGILEYRVGLAARSVYRAAPPVPESEREPTLDLRGVSTRIRELSAQIAAGFPPRQAADRIQQYLNHNYTYTLDFLGRDSKDPIEDFLFKYRTGHCEYFATSMILMLRSVGIPARLVTGFVGAEFNPLEDFYIVRQSNAHAWVEAWFDGTGWVALDPTPAAGRPIIPTPSIGMVLRQAWDYLEFRWDRYVMSYGFFDQIGLLLKLRDAWRQFENPFKVPDTTLGRGRDGDGPLAWEGVSPELMAAFRTGAIGLLVASLAIVAVAVSVHRRRFDATYAYRALRSSLHRREPTIGAATAPLALQRWVERHMPQVSQPTGEVIHWYLLESYGGRGADGRDPSLLRRNLRQVKAALRRRPGRQALDP